MNILMIIIPLGIINIIANARQMNKLAISTGIILSIVAMVLIVNSVFDSFLGLFE